MPQLIAFPNSVFPCFFIQVALEKLLLRKPVRLKCHPLANYHYAGRFPCDLSIGATVQAWHPRLEHGITLHSLLSAAGMAAFNRDDMDSAKGTPRAVCCKFSSFIHD